jgi:hypothetical protein
MEAFHYSDNDYWNIFLLPRNNSKAVNSLKILAAHKINHDVYAIKLVLISSFQIALLLPTFNMFIVLWSE